MTHGKTGKLSANLGVSASFEMPHQAPSASGNMEGKETAFERDSETL